MGSEMCIRDSIGPSADIYSFGVVMWEVWSRRKPWSELSDKQDIFKAVRDERRTLSLPENEDAPDGYDDLMRRCCAYKVSQRPLIDVVRDNLQDLLERAAEMDREKTAHLELTREGSLARSKLLLDMIRSSDDEETKTSSSSELSDKKAMFRQKSSKTNRSRINSGLRRHSTGSDLQGKKNSTSVQIEMGAMSSSISFDDDNCGLDAFGDSKNGICETPFKL